VHLRGLTRNDPTVDLALRGTYAGAARRAAYLADLGITAGGFPSIHETRNALSDLQQYADQQNYWGYDSISYFAPDRRCANDQSPGGLTRAWIAMVKAFHDAGLKVYVDVVYNHHEEGDVDTTGTVGTIYSLRGIDNPNYYVRVEHKKSKFTSPLPPASVSIPTSTSKSILSVLKGRSLPSLKVMLSCSPVRRASTYAESARHLASHLSRSASDILTGAAL
jgi:hypothetical protein